MIPQINFLFAVFFPLVIPLWKDSALTVNSTAAPQALTWLSDESVAAQSAYFKKASDPLIRKAMVSDFAKANNPAAFSALELLLADEKDVSVRDEILAVMYSMRNSPLCVLKNPSALKKYFSDSSEFARAYSASIYFSGGKDFASLLALLQTEKSAFVKKLLWTELASMKSFPDLRKLEAFYSASDSLDRAFAFFISARDSADPDSLLQLKSALKDSDFLVRSKLASALALRASGGEALLDSFAASPEIQIRTIVASMQASDRRESILLRLAADSDFEVRRLAVKGLASVKSAQSLQVLVNALKDKSSFVRDEALASIIKRSPSPEDLSSLEFVLDDRNGSLPAARLIGSLKLDKFNSRLIDKMKSASQDESVAVYMEALAALKEKSVLSFVQSKISSSNPAMRTAVAKSLGLLNAPESYKDIEKLIRDKDQNVSLAAIKAAELSSSQSFGDVLLKVLSDFSASVSGDQRAAAAHAVAVTGIQRSDILKALRKIAVDKTVPEPMGGMLMFDSDASRISAVLAVIDLAKKGNKEAAAAAPEILKDMMNPRAMPGMTEPVGATLTDFVRQTTLYMNGEENIPAVMLEFIKPDLTYAPYSARN